jgi:hypothetical protein
VIEYLLSNHKALGSIPHTEEQKEGKKERRKEGRKGE